MVLFVVIFDGCWSFPIIIHPTFAQQTLIPLAHVVLIRYLLTAHLLLLCRIIFEFLTSWLAILNYTSGSSLVPRSRRLRIRKLRRLLVHRACLARWHDRWRIASKLWRRMSTHRERRRRHLKVMSLRLHVIHAGQPLHKRWWRHVLRWLHSIG